MVLVVNNGPEADPRPTPMAAMAVAALILPVWFLFALAQNLPDSAWAVPLEHSGGGGGI